LETWVFIAICALAGFLVIACGFGKELSFAFIAVGVTTISFGSLIVVKRFRKWLEKI